MEWVTWFILHNAYMFATNAIAPKIFVENNFFLQHHNGLFGLAMLVKKVFFILQFINIFPSATIKRLHVSRKADVVKDVIPIKREGKVTKRRIRGVVRLLIRR